MNIFDTFLNGKVFIETLPMILSGLSTTILLGLTSIACGFVLGLVLALARLYARQPWRWLATAYIDFFRAIPILVLLIVVYYALPFAGLRLPAFGAAVTAISMVAAAYSAEIFRAGIEAVPSGQFEAARALGLRPWLVMSRGATAGAAHRGAPDDVKRHQRAQGYRARVGRRDARPAEAGEAGPGAGRQPDAADRRRRHLRHHSPAARAPRVAHGEELGGGKAMSASPMKFVTMTLVAEALDGAGFAGFGSVLAAGDAPGTPVNEGRGVRIDLATGLVHDTPASQPSFAVYRMQASHWPVPVRLMERHPHSAQMFVPMTGGDYLVVVAPAPTHMADRTWPARAPSWAGGAKASSTRPAYGICRWWHWASQPISPC